MPAASNLNIKYVRDSEEYWTLTQQVYRLAAEAVEKLPKPSAPTGWAVVLDVDETALDNSIYQLERAAYGLPFSPSSWGAWVRRAQAPAVPGVTDFIARVRAIAGNRIAWITDREWNAEQQLDLTAATKTNLANAGLWDAKDLLCMRAGSDKKARRRELRTGSGACSWAGTRIEPVVFVGDQMADFPEPDEREAGSDEGFGRRFFILPQPMYGRWVSNVTRPNVR
jgi:5'-nucleotidase (lipoprotein e(P4) family)